MLPETALLDEHLPDDVQNHGLHELVSQIRLRLMGAKLIAQTGTFELPPIDMDEARAMLRSATEAIHAGKLGYGISVAIRTGETG